MRMGELDKDFQLNISFIYRIKLTLVVSSGFSGMWVKQIFAVSHTHKHKHTNTDTHKSAYVVQDDQSKFHPQQFQSYL